MVWERRIALIYHWQLSVTANEEPAHVDNDEDDDEEEEEHDENDLDDDEDYSSRALQSGALENWAQLTDW